MLMLLTTALAAVPKGYSEIKAGNDCKIYKGPATSTGVVPIFADCWWKEVSPDKLHALLTDWAGHAAVHATVLESKVLKTEGGRALVHQTHALSGVSNREVDLWMDKKPVTGGFQYSWKSPGPVTPAKGNVATAFDEGYWRVTGAEGGSHVEYQLVYDPGGSVPGFLVRWFQGSGTLTTTEELRAAGSK